MYVPISSTMRASVEMLTEGALAQSVGRCLFARDKPLRKTGHELKRHSICAGGMDARLNSGVKACVDDAAAFSREPAIGGMPQSRALRARKPAARTKPRWLGAGDKRNNKG
jgi:hypothetical protein